MLCDGMVFDIIICVVFIMCDLIELDDLVVYVVVIFGMVVSDYILLVFCDLQVVKVSGVIFVVLMVECVIEEQVVGDFDVVEVICICIGVIIGVSLCGIKFGSFEVMCVKEVLLVEGLWL